MRNLLESAQFIVLDNINCHYYVDIPADISYICINNWSECWSKYLFIFSEGNILIMENIYYDTI